MSDESGGAVTLSWLGHSTVVLEMDGVRLLADPLLRRHAGVLRRYGPTPRAEQWRDADAVLISHLHHDHAELRSLRPLGDLPVLTAPGNAEWLSRRGLRAVALDGAWHPVGAGDVEVAAVRADHHSRPMPHRPNAACGHLVRGPSGVVWLAGDTSWYPEMAEFADLAGRPVDGAVVPVGGWGPRLSGGHMDPDQAARAVETVGARWATPVHWGSFHMPLMTMRSAEWLTTPGPLFVEALARHAPACRPLLLSLGESRTVAV